MGRTPLFQEPSVATVPGRAVGVSDIELRQQAGPADAVPVPAAEADVAARPAVAQDGAQRVAVPAAAGA